MEPSDPFDLGLYWDQVQEPEADSLNDLCDCGYPYVTCPQPEICKDDSNVL
jgi:hypothetical protein